MLVFVDGLGDIIRRVWYVEDELECAEMREVEHLETNDL